MAIPWIPISKSVVRKLLQDHTAPYSKSIALLSVALDCNNESPVTIAGYAKLWGWSDGKVRRFLEKIGAKIEYPDNTKFKQNQRGVIVTQKPKRSGNKSEQNILLDFRGLQTGMERTRETDELIQKGSQHTTRNKQEKTDRSLESQINIHQQAAKDVASEYGLE